MSDSTILYTGIFCFSFVVLHVVLTMRAFNKIVGSDVGQKPQPRVVYSTEMKR